VRWQLAARNWPRGRWHHGEDGELIAALIAIFAPKPVMRGKVLNIQTVQTIKWTRRGRKHGQMWTYFMRPATTQKSNNQNKLVLADGDWCFFEMPIKATSFLMQLQPFPGQTSSSPIGKLQDLLGTKQVLKLDRIVRQAVIFSDFLEANVVPVDGTPSFLEFLCSDVGVDSGTAAGTSVSHAVRKSADFRARAVEASAALLARSAALSVEKAYAKSDA